jgi:hypothetical protein
MVKDKKKVINEPTFDKQMDAYEGNDEDPIFSHAYHQFMINLLKSRDSAVKDELKKSVAEVLEPWHYKLDLIINNQTEHGQTLDYLKTMAMENRGRIEALETSVAVHNTILDGHNKVLKSLRINKNILIILWLTFGLSIITALGLLFHIL